MCACRDLLDKSRHSLTRTPGPQAGLYKAHSGNQMVELRKAKATDTPVCECTICCLGVSEWLYEMVAVRSHKVEGEIQVGV